MTSPAVSRVQSPTIQTAEQPEDGAAKDEAQSTGQAPVTAKGTAAAPPAPAPEPHPANPIEHDLFDSPFPSASAPPPPPDDPAQPYQDPEPDALLPPADFKPFFTLIADPSTGTHHHPTVQYLFADDDPEILTSAALHSIAPAAEEETEEAEERVVIVDLAADGKTVTNAVSLSKEWQGVRVEVGGAPSMSAGQDKGDVERGLMMRVEGREVGDVVRGREDEGLEGLVRRFGEVVEGCEEVVGRERAV